MKILYLFPRDYYEHKMHRRRVYWARALQKRDDVDLKLWGHGWGDYGYKATLQFNIDQHLDGWQPDIVVPYVKLGRNECKGLSTCQAKRVLIFTDANHSQYAEAVAYVRPSLIIFSQYTDPPRWPQFETATCKCQYLLWGANEHLYRRGPPLVERPVGLLLAGVTSNPPYMLRATCRRLIQEGLIDVKARIRPHPGDRLANAKAVDAQMEDYAADLRAAQLVLCDGGPWGYVIGKYIEAIASGCLVIGDKPADPEFCKRSKGIFFVDRNISMDGLADKINGILTYRTHSSDELQARADGNWGQYQSHHTLACWAARFVEIVKEIL